jgi:hypothetical protein
MTYSGEEPDYTAWPFGQQEGSDVVGDWTGADSDHHRRLFGAGEGDVISGTEDDSQVEQLPE